MNSKTDEQVEGGCNGMMEEAAVSKLFLGQSFFCVEGYA